MTPKKASVELREENKIVSSKLKELKSSKKELREKHNKLEGYIMSSPLVTIC